MLTNASIRGQTARCKWWLVALGLPMLAMLSVASEWPYREGESYRSLDQRVCPILDMPFAQSSALELSYTLPAKNTAPAWDEIATVDINAWLRFLYLENSIGSDFEMQASWNSMVLQNFDGASSGYPLTMVTIPIRWSQRYLNGWGMQVEADPGVYSTLETLGSDDLSIPFGIRALRAVSPDVAVFFGVKFFPGFDQVAVPRVGLRWASRDTVVLDLAYPESRFEYRPWRSLRFHLTANHTTWPEYNMGDDPREKIMYDETRFRAGIDIGVSQNLELTLQGGYAFDRELAFKAESSEVEIDDSQFFGVGIRGRL